MARALNDWSAEDRPHVAELVEEHRTTPNDEIAQGVTDEGDAWASVVSAASDATILHVANDNERGTIRAYVASHDEDFEAPDAASLLQKIKERERGCTSTNDREARTGGLMSL